MMPRIGVGVEGPSDQKFWRRFLRRAVPGHVFDIRNMKNRPKLIRDAPRLLTTFHDLAYSAGIIILDLDENPCVQDVRKLFDASLHKELRCPRERRYLQLCVAAKELESWFLADYEGVKKVLPKADYKLPSDTCIWGSGKLKELWRQQYGRRSMAFNKIDFADRIAQVFSIDRAARHSASLRTAWERINIAVTRK